MSCSLSEEDCITHCGLELVVIVSGLSKPRLDSCITHVLNIEKFLLRIVEAVFSMRSSYGSSGQLWDRECQNIFNVYHHPLPQLKTLVFKLWASLIV